MSVTRDSIGAAHRRIGPWIRRTPVIDFGIDGLSRPVALKLELLQHSGSFKARGAFNSLLDLDIGSREVTAASGGNHGAAVALAAQALGLKARIFVPEISSPAKRARIASYGADVVTGGRFYRDALALCEAHIARTGAIGIHAYDAAATLDGQGTVALELEEDISDLDTLLVAVGGGGLIGGIAAWYEGRVRVVGVESALCNTLHASLQAGERVTISPSGIAADSLGASRVGELMFPIARRHVAQTVLVEDHAILAAQRHLWHSLRLVTEAGGAAAFAALLSGAYVPHPDERVGVLLCGANADPAQFLAAAG